jgi:magnesium-protoporphyrin O-methyltransferase
VKIVYGDLLELSKDLSVASLVTLDRVVCCYPSHEPMLEKATRHAERAIALSYPRDRWFVRAAMWVENARRARKSGFQIFVHPPAAIKEAIERNGFQLARRRSTTMWMADIFVRRR